MDAFDCLASKLDIREFDAKPVPHEVKSKVLEAARLTGSGSNTQHWRFILAQESETLSKLAKDSTTGKWVENANFAVVVLTGTKYGFYLIDAGRAVQNMQVAGWNYGVVSCVFTGMDQDAFRRDFEVPNDLNATITVGFGYPKKKLKGKKNRKPLNELVFLERFGEKLDPNRPKA